MSEASFKYCGSLGVIIVSLLIIKPALAEMTSSTDTFPVTEALSSSTTNSSVMLTDTGLPVFAPTTSTSSSDTTNASADLVEVKLACTKSYTAPLYDTPSGHLEEGYFLGDATASTTGMTAAHEIGEGAWTVCHDARGHTHELLITAQEYAALAIRGTPQESVMESAADAALDAFPGTDQ